MSTPVGESGHFSGFGFPVSPEISTELYFYAGELQNARERQLGSIHDGQLSNLSDKPYMVADYISAVYSIDTLGNTVVSRESIADLCAIKEQTSVVLAEFAPSEQSLEYELYRMKLESTAWAYAAVENIGQDRSYIEAAREVAKMLSPEKAQSVNLIRFASRMWLDRFPSHQKDAAMQASSIIFARLMRNELMRIESVCDRNSLSPCTVFERRQRALDSMSDYAFAAMPMGLDEAQSFINCELPN